MNLSGKKILITGGGSGIGLELARRLSARNDVVIADLDEAGLERARSETPRLRTLLLDVGAEEDVYDALVRLEAELGGLDLLVNNAGLTGSMRMTRLALPLLEASADAGVLFTSRVRSLTRSLRAVLERRRIRVFEVQSSEPVPASIAEAILRALEDNREEIRLPRSGAGSTRVALA
jgi:uncharacterized oxidoreductase